MAPTGLDRWYTLYKYMYSLPDFFKVKQLRKTAVKYEWVAGLEYLNILRKRNRIDLMQRLRKSSRYMPATTDDADGHADEESNKIVTEIVDYTTDENFTFPFDSIIKEIRNRITPKPNDDDM